MPSAVHIEHRRGVTVLEPRAGESEGAFVERVVLVVALLRELGGAPRTADVQLPS